jgi:predicted metal-dependent peptidase
VIDAADAVEPAQLAESERDWQIKVEQAASIARGAGQLPGGVATAIRETKQAQVDYRDQLRNFMVAAAKADLDWTRPARNYLPMSIYLPSVRSEAMGQIIVAIDTSLSITDDTLTLFAGELTACIEAVNPERVHVLFCDTQVHRHDEYTADDLPLTLTAIGRGGTRLAAIFDYAREHDIEPACAIVLTDLVNYDFGDEPSYPVLWVSTDATAAPFGEVIKIAAA